MIYIENKRKKAESIVRAYPDSFILDITSSSPYRYGQLLSPFYPHGGIPVPGESKGMTAMCVEAIWQGLKVFETCGIDTSLFTNTTMKGLKRTVRKYGRPIGHQYGVFSNILLNYSDAKRLIYYPTYRFVLDSIPEVQRILNKIREQSLKTDIVFLDYNTNPGNRDTSKPISHAELVKAYLEDNYPI